MVSKQGRVMRSGLLGGLVGVGAGLWIGGFLVPALTGIKQDDHNLLLLYAYPYILLSQVLGGVICTIVGAALGAALAAATHKADRPYDPPNARQDPQKGLAAPPESTEAEVARLKAGFAKLEERQRCEGTGEPQEAATATEITTQQGPSSATIGITSRIEPNKAEPGAAADRPGDDGASSTAPPA